MWNDSKARVRRSDYRSASGFVDVRPGASCALCPPEARRAMGRNLKKCQASIRKPRDSAWVTRPACTIAIPAAIRVGGLPPGARSGRTSKRSWRANISLPRRLPTSRISSRRASVIVLHQRQCADAGGPPAPTPAGILLQGRQGRKAQPAGPTKKVKSSPGLPSHDSPGARAVPDSRASRTFVAGEKFW